MILPDFQIEQRCFVSAGTDWGEPLIVPYNDSQLQPASYDVRLANVVRVPPVHDPNPVDLRKPPEDRTAPMNITRGYLLQPGCCVLGSTVEWVNVPTNLVGRVEGKSTRARQWLQIHSAGYLDPGFQGNVTLELVNFGPAPIRLWPDVLIAQFSFEPLTHRCRQGYSTERNHYQGSKGVMGAGGGWA